MIVVRLHQDEITTAISKYAFQKYKEQLPPGASALLTFRLIPIEHGDPEFMVDITVKE